MIHLPANKYTGPSDDPNYFRAGFPPDSARTRNIKVFINGVDRSNEVYECYQGKEGWANLYLKEGDPPYLKTVQPIQRYCIYGYVEVRSYNEA